MSMSTQLVSRDRLVMVIGAVLLAGGLLGLRSPVFLGDYDMYGMQVTCGNGLNGQLLQATVDDQEAARRAPGDRLAGAGPAAGYVERCQSALAHRRAWAIPAAGLGVLALTFEMVTWARRRAMAPDSPTDTWTEAPDDFLHEAAYLDRRALPQRERPQGTTL